MSEQVAHGKRYGAIHEKRSRPPAHIETLPEDIKNMREMFARERTINDQFGNEAKGLEAVAVDIIPDKFLMGARLIMTGKGVMMEMPITRGEWKRLKGRLEDVASVVRKRGGSVSKRWEWPDTEAT